jgi:tetratricopeptide (TPR) repeat protein
VTLVAASLALAAPAAAADDKDSLAAHRSPPLLESFLLVDRTLVDAGTASGAWDRAWREVAALDGCHARHAEPEARAGCYLEALFGADGMRPAPRAARPAASTLATALVERRGSCAALVAVALALTDDLGRPFEAVVLRDHVLLGLRGAPGVRYELRESGRPVAEADLGRHPLPPGGPARVAGRAFLPYYLDNLAARYAEAGEIEAAERLFVQALDLAPRAARLRYNFGTFLLDRDRHAEALEHLTSAIRLGWRDADALVNRGVALLQLDRPHDARRSFRRALRVDPGNPRAVANLALLAE